MNAAVAAAKKQRLQMKVDSDHITVSPAFDMTDAISTLDHIDQYVIACDISSVQCD